MPTDLDLVGRIADRTADCPITIWGFGVGTALAALVRADAILQRPRLAARVADLIDPVLEVARRDVADPTDHLIAVDVLQAQLRARPSAFDEVTALEQRFVRAVTKAARPTPGRPRVHRPDKSPWRTTVWVDCMHTDGPGLIDLGLVAAAVEVTEESARVLQRADGLFAHGYDVATGTNNGVAWGRGQGWALLGLTAVLARTNRSGLKDRLVRLMTALQRHEHEGTWKAVVDRADAAVEPSTSAYVALAVGRAVTAGTVDPEWSDLAERANTAALTMTIDGVLPVSDATPVGRVEDYLVRPLGRHPWGQGPLLAAALDRLGAPEEAHR